MLTTEQLEFLKDKYGPLLITIANHISGDHAISHEDIVQELYIACDEAIKGFTKQDNGKNGDWDKFKSTPGFKKYLKTTLWNKKNNIGSTITETNKRLPTYSMEMIKELDDTNTKLRWGRGMRESSPTSVIEDKYIDNNHYRSKQDLSVKLDGLERKVSEILINDPTVFMSNGKLNIKAVKRLLGVSQLTTEKLIEGIRRKYRDYLQEN